MQNKIQNGQIMDYTPDKDVQGGALIVFPGMVAVAVTDIPAGALGALDTEGVFELPKSPDAFAQGQVVSAKPDGTIMPSDGQLTVAGKVWASAAKEDQTVLVKINA